MTPFKLVTLKVISEKTEYNTFYDLCKKYNIIERTFRRERTRLVASGHIIKHLEYTKYELSNKGKSCIIESKHSSYSTPVINKSEYPKKYIISSATSKTQINREFFNALLGYTEFIDAELIIMPVYYKNISLMSHRTEIDESFIPEVEQYLHTDRANLNNNLVLMCDIPISPTAKHPLTGFDTISGDRSAIFGSPNLAMTAIATPSLKLPKLLYTTGSISKPNYSRTKMGKIGESHHTNSALIIELEDENIFHIRNLIWSDESGSFCDLRYEIFEDNIRENKSVPAIVFGDLHQKFLNKEVEQAAFFGENTIINHLNPEDVVIHDSLDFYAQNHHHKGASIQFKKYIDGDMCIRTELDELIKFHKQLLSVCTSNILYVDSNHDRALDRFLDESDIRDNPENAIIYHELNAKRYRYYVEHRQMPNALQLYFNEQVGLNRTIFLDNNVGHKIKDINISMHGDMGSNGSRGNLKGFCRIGEESIIGHSHTPGIALGVFQVGTSSELNLGYNKGPSSWMHTCCVIYPNGKRSLINFINGKYKL